MIVGQEVKQPGDVFAIGVDFEEDLAAGETINSATVTARNAKTDADSSGTVLTGAPHIISGPEVAKTCQAGAHGDHHVVTFHVVTSLGNEYQHEVELLVVEE